MSTYGARLRPALQELVDLLTGAGVPASLDRATLRVPGAWVRPDTVSHTSLAGHEGPATAKVSVLLVAPVEGDGEALADLGRLLDKVLALHIVNPEEDVDTSVVLPIRNNAHPAFRLVVDLDF